MRSAERPALHREAVVARNRDEPFGCGFDVRVDGRAVHRAGDLAP